MGKPVIVHVTDRAGPYPTESEKPLYVVVEAADLAAAAGVLAHRGADLLIIDLDSAPETPPIHVLRARFPNLPVVVIAPPVRSSGDPPTPGDAARAAQNLPVEVLQDFSRPSDRAGTDAAPPPLSVRSKEIAGALTFMRENYWKSNLSLGKVAKIACMSRCHFSRTFKRVTGVRYIDYLTKLRLEQGMAQLQRTDRSVTEICLDIGYNDLTHFERVFKKWFGVAPSEARRRRSVPVGALSPGPRLMPTMRGP